MTLKYNRKTMERVRQGLKCCFSTPEDCNSCPYKDYPFYDQMCYVTFRRELEEVGFMFDRKKRGE